MMSIKTKCVNYILDCNMTMGLNVLLGIVKAIGHEASDSGSSGKGVCRKVRCGIEKSLLRSVENFLFYFFCISYDVNDDHDA